MLARITNPVDQLVREMDSLFRVPFVADRALPSNWTVANTWSPPADVMETRDAVLVKLDLPGHDPKRLEVRLEADTLTVSSERRQPGENEETRWLRSERNFGTFTRSFTLPATVESQKCEAKFEHGVLTITLPKREEARPRTIDIKVLT